MNEIQEMKLSGLFSVSAQRGVPEVKCSRQGEELYSRALSPSPQQACGEQWRWQRGHPRVTARQKAQRHLCSRRQSFVNAAELQLSNDFVGVK